MQLNKLNNLTFDEQYHKYVDSEFNFLNGITAIIKKCISPDLYNGIPEEVLHKAALHGSICHRLCEAFDNAELELQDDNVYTTKTELYIYDNNVREDVYLTGDCILNPELYEYIKLIARHDLLIEASEYLVSDGKYFASSIDKVIRESDDEFSIADLKFTSSYHEEPVRWQTSFYADMFEQQNPTAKVKNLYCIHIHKKDGNIVAELHKLKRIPHETLEECKRCFLTDTPFDNPIGRKEISLYDFNLEAEGEQWDAESIAELVRAEKELADKKKKIVAALKEWFKQHPKNNKLITPFFSVAQSTASTSFCFDEQRLKEEQPDIYNAYCTGHKTIPGRTLITLKQK